MLLPLQESGNNSLFADDNLPADKNKEMLLIEGADVKIGLDEKRFTGKAGFNASVDELPLHTVTLKPYYIDITEVTVREYEKFLKENNRAFPGDPKFPDVYPWTKDNPPPDDLLDHPVIYVSWYDANKFCEWKNKRLPTETEWEYAAKGKTGNIYPWGDKYNAALLNSQDSKFSGTKPVKSFPKDISPFGIYDMAGNVSEWTSSWYNAYPGSGLKRNNFGEKLKVIRGGAWVLPGEYYARTTNRTQATKPAKKHRGIGFRCAMDYK